MVRSKDVSKKPRDPLLTPPSKLRGAGFLDEDRRPGNRGGAAMSPAPASVPNYMRGTSSSDAKGGRRRGARFAATAAPASASPARRRRTPAAVRVMPRGKVLFPEPKALGSSGPGLGRATCSSTLKGARFPDALDLAPGATDAEGPAAMRVCPYTYCSLNGHAHAPAVPLRSFLASRRRLIKTQQSMKHKGVSAFRKKSAEKNGGGGGGGAVAAAAKIAPLIDDEAVGDFFVEVYAGPRVSSDMSCSDMSVDETDDSTVRKMEFVVFDRCGADEDTEKGEDIVFCGNGDGRVEDKQGACRDSSSVCSDAVISGDFIEELPWMRYHGSEYDSLDDGISEEQRARDDEIDQAQISKEQEDEVDRAQISEEQEDEIDRAQISEEKEDEIDLAQISEEQEDEIDQTQISGEQEEGNCNEGISGRTGDECGQKIAEDLEANDENSISNLVLGLETIEEKEAIACRVEVCQELDGRDEGNILDALCPGERSAGQAEEKLSDTVDKLEIPDQDVSGAVDSSIIEERCIEEAPADQEEKDAVSIVKSDDGSEIMPDEGSEMEISEDTTSNRYREDFSEEVTSKAAITDEVFEQHDNNADESFANDVFEQDGSTENTQSDAQKELGITTSEIENTSEGSDIVYSIVDGMKDAHKEMEITASRLEESCEKSGAANESNSDNISCFDDDDAQTEQKITTCMPSDASVESVSQGSSPDGKTEYVADGAMGPETTKCKLEGAYKETVMDQEAVEGDDSVHLRDDSQNDEAKQSDNSISVHSDTQNGSNHTTSELALSISEKTENEPELIICQPEDVSEESGTSQESDHDGFSAYVMDLTQNEYEFTNFKIESAQEEEFIMDVKEDSNSADSQKKLENTACVSDGASENPATSQEADESESAQEEEFIMDVKEDSNSADSQKKLDNTACESDGASEKPATSQEADGHVNTVDSSHSAQKDNTIQKLDAFEDTQTAEESAQLFNVEIPEPKNDCTAQGHEPESIALEVTGAKEPSVDDICDAFSGMNLKGDVYFDLDESATCPRNKLIISRRRRTPEEEEYLRGFNPRAPNFLPLELDPDAEKVDLRHQMVDERKNAEEWMIDYALRRAVTNLAPARKKKVELLVQAFETVLPHDEDDKKSMTPPRPLQPCN